jgi:hypothetical protein
LGSDDYGSLDGHRSRCERELVVAEGRSRLPSADFAVVSARRMLGAGHPSSPRQNGGRKKPPQRKPGRPSLNVALSGDGSV